MIDNELGSVALRNSKHPEAGTVLAGAVWRKSSFSGSGGTGGGDCVEVAPLADVLFTRTEIAAWAQGCKAGEFDDLTTPDGGLHQSVGGSGDSCVEPGSLR